jgi:hypothetical protein
MNVRLCWSMLLSCGPLATPALAQAEAPEHLLRVGFRPGDPQFYRKTMVARMGPEDAPLMSGTVATTLEYRVTGVADGKAQVQQTVRRMVYSVSGPGDRKAEYDSQAGGGDPGIAAVCARIVDHVTTMKVDDRGCIGDIADLPQLGPTRSSVPLVLPVPLPDAPVAIGKAWEVKAMVAVPEMSDQEALLVSKLVSLEKGRAVIETEVRIDPDKVTLPPGVKIAKYTETTVVDLATGRMTGGTSELRWSGNGPQGKQTENVMTTKVEAIDPPQPKPEGKQGEAAAGSGKG